MTTVIDVVLFVIGAAIVVAAIVVAAMASAIKSTVLPRATRNRIVTLVAVSMRLTLRALLRRTSGYERRDRVMAFFGPVTLIAQLASWIALIFIGYSLMFLGVETTSVKRAAELSGSSVTTLGSATSSDLHAQLLTYSEAALGLVLLTLLITYLPTIYQSCSRREKGVGLLAVRAGSPPRATTMLIRYHHIEDVNFRLTELWRTWESWFIDVEETHTSYPILVDFRSLRSDQSWVNSAGVLLDAASLWVSSIEHANDPDAQLCIRAGYLSLGWIASNLGIPFDPDPAPDDPVSIAREEFESACDEMAKGGINLKADRAQAWKAFAGWRVNYDTVLLNLARFAEAPPVPWVSDRSPARPDQIISLRRVATTRLVGTSRKSNRRRHPDRPGGRSRGRDRFDCPYESRAVQTGGRVRLPRWGRDFRSGVRWSCDEASCDVAHTLGAGWVRICSGDLLRIHDPG